MAGYSGTLLPQKLGIKPGHTLCFLNAPEDWQATLGAVPDGCTEITLAALKKPVDVFVAFAIKLRDLKQHLAKAKPRLAPAGGLWIAWPKKSSGVPTELDENIVRELGLATGLVDNKVYAIDEVWSGLRFVIR